MKSPKIPGTLALSRGDTEALQPAQVRGMELFFSERLGCFHCQGGFTFTYSRYADPFQ